MINNSNNNSNSNLTGEIIVNPYILHIGSSENLKNEFTKLIPSENQWFNNKFWEKLNQKIKDKFQAICFADEACDFLQNKALKMLYKNGKVNKINIKTLINLFPSQMFVFIKEHLIKNGLLITHGINKKFPNMRNLLSDVFSLHMNKFGGVTFENNDLIYNIYYKIDVDTCYDEGSDDINKSSESDQYHHLNKMLLGELPYRWS